MIPNAISTLDMTQGFPGASAVNNLSANAGDARETSAIPKLGRLPEKKMATHFQYSCPENKPCGLPSMGSQRVIHNWVTKHI